MLTKRRSYQLGISLIVIIIVLFVGWFIVPRSIESQNDIPIDKAIQENQITALFRGVREDGRRFEQPMLEFTLTNHTQNQITFVIPQGLTFSSDQNYADIVTLKAERVTLQPGESLPAQELLAYSLDYSKDFPTTSSEYELNPIEINENLQNTLDNINNQGLEENSASQIAVWLAYHNLQLEQLEPVLGDLSEYRDSIEELTRVNSTYSYGLLLILIFFVIIIIFFMVRRRRDKSDNKSDNKSIFNDLKNWEQIDEGGMTEVWLAYDENDFPFIVKFPRTDNPHVEPDVIRKRFERGVAVLSRLKHDNIVMYIGWGEGNHPNSNQSAPYMIQEFIDGCTIEKLLYEQLEGKLKTEEIIEISMQILEALDYMHKQGAIHKDLKLSNVMLDQEGRVHIIDFSTSTFINSTFTKVNNLPSFYTPPYHPPYKKKSEENNEFLDLYALSVLIYAMYGGELTEYGNPSVERDAIIEMMNKSDNIPQNIKDMIFRCLNKGYSTATEFRKDLRLVQRSQLAQMIKDVAENRKKRPKNRSS